MPGSFCSWQHMLGCCNNQLGHDRSCEVVAEPSAEEVAEPNA